MKLMTKAIEQAAQKQYHLGADFNQKVVAKFFNPTGRGTWYLMNQDPEDPDYCWGIVRLYEVEAGSFSLSELQYYQGRSGLGIERDLFFIPMLASDVWARLQNGEHI
jgi:hypothetical protein